MTAPAQPSPPLHAVQRWMQSALLAPDGAGGAEPLLCAGGRLDAAAGLAVYQRAFFLRIAACMREQFPALCHALGRELFDDFVAEYLRACPPQSHTLYDLGRRFAAFLEASRPDSERGPEEREPWADFMVDLATFERLVFTLFDAAGTEDGLLAEPATPDERLRLQPCFALGAYRFDVPAYYHSVRLNGSANLPPERRAFVALVRTGYVTRTLRLEEPDHVFLSGLADGGGVDQGLDALARHLGIDRSEVVAAWRSAPGGRRRWLEAGIFVDARAA